MRDHDLVGLIGGEEFGVLLKGASWEQAMSVCDRLRIRCSERPLRIPSGEVIQVTVSAGVVEVTPGKTSAQIYRAADEALYRAKAQGRNQIAA